MLFGFNPGRYGEEKLDLLLYVLAWASLLH